MNGLNEPDREDREPWIDDQAAEDIAREKYERRNLRSSIRAVQGEGFESNWRSS